jgi:predicted DNA-binding transcriptional regulator AlpA
MDAPGFIPHIKFGNLVRFRISQVEKWLEARTAMGRPTIRANII